MLFWDNSDVTMTGPKVMAIPRPLVSSTAITSMRHYAQQLAFKELFNTHEKPPAM